MSDHGIPEIPADHPRAKSLYYRHKLVEGMEKKVVTPSGLCAHGRGEAFDYLLGEQTIPPAMVSIEAAVAAIMTATHPVISVNGNVAALVPEDIVKLSQVTGAPLEINLFYRAPGRVEAIAEVLTKAGAKNLLGLGDVEPQTIKELSSNRRIVDPRGIYSADVVMVPIEDGDRTEALVKEKKFVIAIDLNPLSRTAQMAHITIVDNIIRVIKHMITIAEKFKTQLSIQPKSLAQIKKIVIQFDQQKNLSAVLEYMAQRLLALSKKTS
jgi:4-phosphopantoate---beta-alanine ligase